MSDNNDMLHVAAIGRFEPGDVDPDGFHVLLSGSKRAVGQAGQFLGEAVVISTADIHVATLARAERAEAFAARCNEVVDAAVAERTEELRNERDRVEMDAAIANDKIRDALPARFVLVPPDGGDVKTLEAVKDTVAALERAEALLAEAVEALRGLADEYADPTLESEGPAYRHALATLAKLEAKP